MNEFNINLNEDIARKTSDKLDEARNIQQEITKRDLYADLMAALVLHPESRTEILIKNNINNFPDFDVQRLYNTLRVAHQSNIPFSTPEITQLIVRQQDYIKTGQAEMWEGSLYSIKNDKLIKSVQSTLLRIFQESNNIIQEQRDLSGKRTGLKIDPHINAYAYNNELEQIFLKTRDKAFSEVDNKATIEILDDLSVIVEDARHGRTHEIQWGIPGLNNLVPLRKSELTIVGARSGHGKTAFVISCILQQVLTHEYNIGAYFGELVEERVYARLMAQYANENKDNKEDYIVNYNSIFSGFCQRNSEGVIDIETFNVKAYDEYILAKDYLTKAFSDKLFIKSKTIYLDDLIKNIRNLKQSHDIACYYVDYLQWVETYKGDKREKREKIEEVIRGLNALSTELNLPIIALSQLNRQAANNRPQSSHISGSDIPFNECDNMLLLDMPIIDKGNYNDRKYEFNGRRAQFSDFYNSVVINIAKQRDGEHQGEAFLFGFDPPIAKVTKNIFITNRTYDDIVKEYAEKENENAKE